MKALILAAGRGERLGELTKEKPKALVKVAGISLLERVLESVRELGIKEVYISIGYQGEKIREKIGESYREIKINYLENKHWKKGNLYSVLVAKEKLRKENFLLLMSDHLSDSRVLKKILEKKVESSVILAVDKKKKPKREDTKVLEKDGKVVGIGKHIKKANCIDTGIFLCSPKIFSYAEESAKESGKELTDCIAKAAKNRDAETFDITQIESYASKMRKEIKPWWIDIDTEKDLIKAKEIIVENASKNPSDFLAYYVHKPIENKLVAFISNFNITPNQLTIIVNILAYTVTALFFFGYLLPASILTFVVGIADGLDGKLARVKLMTSKIGSLEHSFDLLFEFSWFIALSWFLFSSTGSYTSLILCIFITLSIAFYRHVYDQFRRAMGKSLDDSGNFERKFRRIAGRRNLYNIPILAGVLLIPLFSLTALIYSLIFILFHSGITAIVYSINAMRHMHAADHKKT